MARNMWCNFYGLVVLAPVVLIANQRDGALNFGGNPLHTLEETLAMLRVAPEIVDPQELCNSVRDACSDLRTQRGLVVEAITAAVENPKVTRRFEGPYPQLFELAGESRDPQVARVLSKHLAYLAVPFDDHKEELPTLEYYPAIRALVRLGSFGFEEMLSVIGNPTSTNHERECATYVIFRVLHLELDGGELDDSQKIPRDSIGLLTTLSMLEHRSKSQFTRDEARPLFQQARGFASRFQYTYTPPKLLQLWEQRKPTGILHLDGAPTDDPLWKASVTASKANPAK